MALEHVSDLLPFYVNGTLAPEEHARVEAHVKRCAECQEELSFWEAVSGTIIAETRAAERLAPELTRVVLAPSESTLLTYLRRAGTIIGGQIPLVRRHLWISSACALVIGLLTLLFAGAGLNGLAVVRALAPLATALGVALVYNRQEYGAAELLDTMPTSPRAVLIARLAIIFSFNALLVLLAGVALGRQGFLLSQLASQWLAPMAMLSSVALLVAVMTDAAMGAAVAGALWVIAGAREQLAQWFGGELLLNTVVFVLKPGALWGLALLHLAAAIWLVGSPRLSRYTPLDHTY